MKKPDTLPKMLGVPAILLGFVFIASGYLSDKGSNENALINTDMILPALGFLFVIGGIAMVLLGQELTQRRAMLRYRGAEVVGTVTKIKTISYIRVARQHPVVVYYNYSYDATSLRGKSELLWGDVTLREGERVRIALYTNKPKTSALKLEKKPSEEV